MSSRNVKTVRQFWDAFNRRDWLVEKESWERVISSFNEDFAFFNNALKKGGVGRAEWATYAQNHLKTMPDVQIKDFDYIDAGDIIISLTTIQGRNTGVGILSLPSTGKEVSWRTCSIWRFDDRGRVRSAEGFEDMLKPMIELGHVTLPIELSGPPAIQHRYGVVAG